MNIKELFLHYLRGISMGAADIVPGVSGGTIALITGIYPRLIRGIDDAIKHSVAIIRSLMRGSYSEAHQAFLAIDIQLFIPLFLGIATSFLSLSHVIHYLLEHEVALIFAFFFGLILGSCIFVMRSISKTSIATLCAFCVGLIFSYSFVGMNPIGANHSLPVIFISGSLAICAMLLPGISGSFLLVFLGQYEHMLEAINNMVVSIMLVFIAGAATGLVLFSRVIDYLLTRHRHMSLACITGLMAGSLRLPYQKINSVAFSPVQVFIVGFAGLLLVLLLEFIFKTDK